MATYTEQIRHSEIILSEAPGTLSRDSITINDGLAHIAGAVMMQVPSADADSDVAAFSGNTGNGTLAVAAANKNGVYNVVFIEPGTDAGKFQVEGPTGVILGTGVVGSPWSVTDLAFTITDGATDFVAGDGFTVTVSDPTVVYAAYDPGTSALAGPSAILLEPADTSLGAVTVTALVRLAEVKKDLLDFNDAEIGLDADQKAAAIALLSTSPTFIVAR